MRVVADSNVLVSAIIFGGKPARLIQLAEENIIQLLLSEMMMAEVTEVLHRKFSHRKDRWAKGVASIRACSQITQPGMPIAECSDPDDNRILEAAVEGNADVIVSGDKHLLVMNPFRRIEICTVNHFLSRFDRSHPGP